jgi:hypothetical protein
MSFQVRLTSAVSRPIVSGTRLSGTEGHLEAETPAAP